MANAPIRERVNLVSFLVQLHPHFPHWRGEFECRLSVYPLKKASLVLSWDAIIETLLEDDYLQKHGQNDDGAAAAHLVIMTSADTIATFFLLTYMPTVDVRVVF